MLTNVMFIKNMYRNIASRKRTLSLQYSNLTVTASALFDSLMASGEGGTTKISETTGRTTMKSLFDVNLNGGTKSEKKIYITYL